MPAKKETILVIDIGTSFVKLGLFDTKANPIEGHQVKPQLVVLFPSSITPHHDSFVAMK